MTDRQLHELLGPVGTDALASAQMSLVGAHPDAEDLELSWAGWTPEEWNFTFVQRAPARRLAVHVPHDASAVSIRVLAPSDRPGWGPLGD